MWREKSIPRLIIITPVVSIVILTVLITYYYIEQLQSYFKEENARMTQEFLTAEKGQSEEWNKKITRFFAYSDGLLEEKIKKKLQERVDLAHSTASYIYDKYRTRSNEKIIKQHIKDALRRMVWEGGKNYIWITDYEGNNILSADPLLHGANLSGYQDTDGRAIILEEIQMVRKHGDGFLKSRFREGVSEQIMYLKDFGHYAWFFGGGRHIDDARESIKAQMLNLMHNVPSDSSGFVAVFDKNGSLYLSDVAQKYLGNEVQKELHSMLKPTNQWHNFDKEHVMLHSDYFAPFGWYVIHGFDTRPLDAAIEHKQKMIDIKIRDEMTVIIVSSVVLGLLAIALSLLFSRRVNAIFAHYKEEVESREASLRDINRFLEKRVKHEVDAHREKERMLIQQSKMAEMGDMLSMIAHQWRQPLNQMSYIFMNIEGAYEYDELTKEYLDKKLKEGTELLEFMSHTIEDFRFCKQLDVKREETEIAEIVDHSAALIIKSLDAHGITLETTHHSYNEVKLYRNELMQVLLNLIKNAKDVLIEQKTKEPKITITTSESEQDVIIEVCDNGGGIDEAIAEKIFEPYFTTKEKSSGTGLGLYMSKNIVQEHLNGELFFKNRGEGACFIVKVAKSQSDASD